MLVKRLVINKARTSVIMCGNEKFTSLMPYTFAGLSDADYMVSDGSVPEAFAKAAKDAGIIVL